MVLSVMEIPLSRIVRDETARSPERTLVESLRRLGLLVPVSLRAMANGRYQIVDGSRRIGGAMELEWDRITALVDCGKGDRLCRDVAAIVINRRRKSLEQLYLARHARRALAQSDMSQAGLARQIGISAGNLSRTLKVLQCPDLVIALEAGEIEFGAARALASLTSPTRKELLAELRRQAAHAGTFPSVREVEEAVRRLDGGEPLPEIGALTLAALAELLEWHALPTDIRVTRGKQSRIQVTLTVSEEDASAVRASLEEAKAAAATRRGAA